MPQTQKTNGKKRQKTYGGSARRAPGRLGHAESVDVLRPAGRGRHHGSTASKFVAEVGTSARRVLARRLVSTVRSLGQRGRQTLLEEKQIRGKLRAGRRRSTSHPLPAAAGSARRPRPDRRSRVVISKASLGFSAIGREGRIGGHGGGCSGLPWWLTRQASSRRATCKLRDEAHSSVVKIDGTPPELIEAIGTLAFHFGDASAVEGLKAIPFCVGTAVGIAQTVRARSRHHRRRQARVPYGAFPRPERREGRAARRQSCSGCPSEIVVAQSAREGTDHPVRRRRSPRNAVRDPGRDCRRRSISSGGSWTCRAR